MLILYPDPILNKKTTLIKDPTSPEIQELIFEMLETMEKNNGLGIAAPQVGKSVRLCIVKLDGQTHILINPILKSKSWKKEIEEEGCLSFPEIFVPVKRHYRVKVEALDRKGNKKIIQAEGLLARAFQHEIDHLDGITIEDRKN